MNLVFGLIAFTILATSVVAMSLRKLIHSALLLVVTWFGIAAFYLWAGAEFIASAQVLIYAGAISMVVLFAVLLTRPAVDAPTPKHVVHRTVAAVVTGTAVAGAMGYAILATPLVSTSSTPPTVSVQQLGTQLMGPHLAAVLIVGVILTSALIGAVVIAATPKRSESEDAS